MNKNIILPDLIIESGEQKTISPRVLHQYENILIKEGGTLFIERNSSQWCVMIAKQSIIIDGELYYRNFKKSTNPIVYKFPDGKIIEHQYNNQSLGGTGGNGGYSRGGSTIKEGGNGALGTSDYGGGGGSCGGAIIQGPQSRGGSRGNNAVDWRGAPPAAEGGFGKTGGNGAKLLNQNGGLLFLSADKFGGNGKITLNGNHGESGLKGTDGSEPGPRGEHGAGGGGGGAPGGEGGRCIIVYKELLSEPIIHVKGGFGGLGGGVGRNPNNATSGSRGEDGESGYYDYIHFDQWV